MDHTHSCFVRGRDTDTQQCTFTELPIPNPKLARFPHSERQAQNLQAGEAYVPWQRHAGSGGGEREDRRGITGGSTGGRGGGVDLGAGRGGGGGGGDAEADPAAHHGGPLASSGPPLAPRTPIPPPRRAPDAHLFCKPLSKLTHTETTAHHHGRHGILYILAPNREEAAAPGQESEPPVRGERRGEARMGGVVKSEEGRAAMAVADWQWSGERRNGMEKRRQTREERVVDGAHRCVGALTQTGRPRPGRGPARAG